MDDVGAAAEAVAMESGDFKNSSGNDIMNNNKSEGVVVDESEGGGGGGGDGGVMNWQNARYKADIFTHHLCEQLLSVHVACLRVATPVDQLPRIDVQLAQPQHVVAKYSSLVKDSGIGISPQDIPKLFTKFAQTQSTATQNSGYGCS